MINPQALYEYILVVCISLVMNIGPALLIGQPSRQRELSERVGTHAGRPAAALGSEMRADLCLLRDTSLTSPPTVPSFAFPDKRPWLCPPPLSSHTSNSLRALGTTCGNRQIPCLPYSQLQAPQGTGAATFPRSMSS